MKTIYGLTLLILPLLMQAQFTFHDGLGLGNPSSVSGFAVAVDDAGNVYAGGSFSQSLEMDPGTGSFIISSNGNTDGFLAKYSSSGDLIWAKAIGGADNDYIQAIDVDTTGNVYVTGSFRGSVDFGGSVLTSAGDDDIFAVKYDTDGQHIWSKRHGGTGNDEGRSIRVDKSGNVALCGAFNDTMDMGTGTLVASNAYSSAYVALLNNNGNTLWAYGFGNTGFGFDRAVGVAYDDAGNIYATGSFSGTNVNVAPAPDTFLLHSNGSADFFNIKYNAAGEFQWAFNIGGTTGDVSFAMDATPAGDFYITGYTNASTIDVDPGADTVLLSGVISNHVQDILVAKYNTDGEYQWGFRIGKQANDIGRGIKVDAQGNVFVCGLTGGEDVDFDPGIGTHLLSGDIGTLNATFLAHYTSNGEFVDAFTLDGIGYANALAVSDDGKVWITGIYNEPGIDLDPGAGSFMLNNAGSSDCFLSGYNYPYLVGVSERNENTFHFHPNPASNHLRLDFGKIYPEVTLEIHNISGQLIERKNLQSVQQYDLNVSQWSEGVYFISVISEEGVANGKFVKQ